MHITALSDAWGKYQRSALQQEGTLCFMGNVDLILKETTKLSMFYFLWLPSQEFNLSVQPHAQLPVPLTPNPPL